MKRLLWVPVLVFLAGAVAMALTPVAAVSSPAIAGSIHGTEWCPKSICGTANFSGDFAGTVDGEPADGRWSVRIEYDDLPLPLDPPAEIRGKWKLRIGDAVFRGSLRGTIASNGDATFDIEARLKVKRGGTGFLYTSSVLDHNVFPPTIDGDLRQ